MAGGAGRPVVKRVAAAETMALRQRVLRPHQTVDQVGFPGDDDPTTVHFAAFDHRGAVVGTCTLMRQPAPWAPGERAWRLRGMATDPEWRGRGVGAAVLAEAVSHVSAAGGGVLWCNARVPAVGFYRRAGFATRGEEWDEPGIGPHVAMHRRVETAV